MDYNDCRQILERITDMVEGVADVKGYDEPARATYQVMCLFRYPLGSKLEIDEYYNGIQALAGDEWSLKLGVEPAQDGTVIAKLWLRTKYNR